MSKIEKEGDSYSAGHPAATDLNHFIFSVFNLVPPVFAESRISFYQILVGSGKASIRTLDGNGRKKESKMGMSPCPKSKIQ